MQDPPSRRSLSGGRYVLLAPLGEGAQGTTWDAVDKREGGPVAIKQFDVRGARAWKDVELAEREARVLGELSHPKLPRYVDHFEEEGVLYLVMEKIEGTPLSVLRKRGPMSEADVVRLLRDADEVLGYLHGRAPPVIHRDLKPSNVIRRADGSFAFVDFGAVRDRLRPEGGSTVVGTFGYMAPEQFQGRSGPGSDVYAIGATALALLAGEEPERLPHRGLAVDVHAALGGHVSRRLCDVLARMLEPNPDARPKRIGPLLALLGGGRERERDWEQDWGKVGDLGREIGREIRGHVEREIHAQIDRASRHGDRRAGRWAKRAERRARRNEERAAHRRGGARALPWFLVILFTLGLTAAQIAVTMALRVVVPLVLVILSVVFGRALRESAKNVSAAGERATEAIGRARSVVQGTHEPKPPPHGPRVGEATRVRVPHGAADDEGARREAGEARKEEEEQEQDDNNSDAQMSGSAPKR